MLFFLLLWLSKSSLWNPGEAECDDVASALVERYLVVEELHTTSVRARIAQTFGMVS